MAIKQASKGSIVGTAGALLPEGTYPDVSKPFLCRETLLGHSGKENTDTSTSWVCSFCSQRSRLAAFADQLTVAQSESERTRLELVNPHWFSSG